MVPAKCFVLTAVVLLLGISQADAALKISEAATQNVSCSGGTCTATAKNAVLNAGELVNMLASGNVHVVAPSAAADIDVNAAISWTSTSRLTLDAYRSIAFNKSLSVAGSGALTLTTNDGGTGGEYAFFAKAHATFFDLNSSLIINGASYTLVGNIAALASDIANNPSGHYALANDYDASADGTYSTVPIPTTFTGTFEGLGNRISNLSIDDATDDIVGLFAEVDAGGVVRDIEVAHANVSGAGTLVGVLAGFNKGAFARVSASGAASNSNIEVGGIVGALIGTITNSHANVAVLGGKCAGGLVGATGGIISQSFAVGMASATEEAGGLVCDNETGTISDSYSRGAAIGGSSADVGGFAGQNDGLGTINYSYSTGKVKGGIKDRSRGGFVGHDLDQGDIQDCYWDVDLSHFRNLHRGAGNIKNDAGITGVTTQQLQAGLPPGFDPSIWGEKSNVNDGLPYLLANPPPK
jgi:hypothetical protein